MHEITPSNNHLINVRWEVSKRSDFFTYEIVTSKRYYHSKQLKKDGTPKPKAKPKNFVIATCMHEDIAEHIVEAHNDFFLV